MNGDPFHAGERQLQSLFASRDRLAGSRAIQASLPPVFQAFLEELSYVVLAVQDCGGHLWVTMVFGAAGFVRAIDAMQIHIGSRPDPADPAAAGIAEGASIAILAIDLLTRRRIRVNGSIVSVGEDGFGVSVRQAFGNCPQFIRPRRVENAPGMVGDAIDTRVIARVVAHADTFFIATRAASDTGFDMDVSHRGGPSGFVRWDGDCLIWPEYRGNFYFNTLGNLLLDPACGLLFPDFGSGELLMLTGHAVLEGFDGSLTRSPEGLPVNGLVRFKPDVLMSRTALPRA